MMGYEITSIEDNRIYIKHDYRDELDGFILLLKSIEGDIGGRIIQMDGDDIRYMIQNDPYDLVFKWDVTSGTAVIVPDGTDIDAVIRLLEDHFDKLNN
ncbi:MAG: hypothetical protein K6G67_00905 [Lachnospiraceae bacterium]|jgi:hypothetical protein|nr:hypothetical protein [Lachnospiraceae bacterium]